MSTRTPDQVFDAFINGTLPKGEWTHEAHLITCRLALKDRTPADALNYLRAAITEHNCGVGTENSDVSGYHETLTVYYVTAVANSTADTFEALFEDPTCGRAAPLQHWSRDVLFGTEARLGWVAPDLRELVWVPANAA